MLRVLQLLHQLHLPLLLLRPLLGQKCEVLLLRLRHLRVRQLLSGSVQVDLWSFRIMLLLPHLSCPLLWIPQLLFCQRCLSIPLPSSFVFRRVAGFLPDDLIWQRWLLLRRVLQLALQRRNQPRSMVPDRREARCLRQREAASSLPQLRRRTPRGDTARRRRRRSESPSRPCARRVPRPWPHPTSLGRSSPRRRCYLACRHRPHPPTQRSG